MDEKSSCLSKNNISAATCKRSEPVYNNIAEKFVQLVVADDVTVWPLCSSNQKWPIWRIEHIFDVTSGGSVSNFLLKGQNVWPFSQNGCLWWQLGAKWAQGWARGLIPKVQPCTERSNWTFVRPRLNFKQLSKQCLKTRDLGRHKKSWL